MISEEELRNATASLLTLDKNKDGKLSDDETRPPRPEGRGPEGRGPEGRGPEGRGPEGRGPEGRGPEGRGPEGRGPEGRGPEGRGPEGRGPEGRGPEGRGPVGPPNPERFVEDAMRFDADGNGFDSPEFCLPQTPARSTRFRHRIARRNPALPQ